MPKHNTYEQDENISDNDIVLGSDAEDSLKTKNFRIGKLKDYFLSFVETIVVNSRPYKVYTALLTQSGIDAPVATVLENTLGDIVWSYNSIGIYHATSIGSFTENKTILPNTYTASTDGAIASTFDFFNLDENIVSIRTKDITGINQDDLINFNGKDFLFEIRVYN